MEAVNTAEESVEQDEQQASLSIDATEIMLQSFAMDHPDVEPTEADFSRDELNAAHDVVKYTEAVDSKLQIEVLEEGTVVSRDVLATYKTLLYRTLCNGERVQLELARYKQVCIVLGIGFVVVAGIAFFGTK